MNKSDLIHIFVNSKDQRKGYAAIRVSSSIDLETYLDEFTDFLVRSGYTSIIREEHPDYSRFYLFYFTKNKLERKQNA